MLESGSWDAKRAIYWSIATVLLCTSIRQNPGIRHLVYTNSRIDVAVGSVKIRRLLKSLGVEVIDLPFRTFVPPSSHCRQFRNAFYKLEVLSELAHQCAGGALLLDSDCIALKPATQLIELCRSGGLVVYDVYRRGDINSLAPHGISRAAMGTCFRSLDADYPEPAPIWFGGEFVGGCSAALAKCGEFMKRAFEPVKRDVISRDIRMPNGAGFFDNDEFFSSFVYNKIDIPKREVAGAFSRLNSVGSDADPRSVSQGLVFAHLPGEKSTGLRHLFFEAVNPDSEFWQVPSPEFGTYLREFVGMPNRTKGLGSPPEIYSPTPRWVLAYRRFLSRLRCLSGFED